VKGRVVNRTKEDAYLRMLDARTGSLDAYTMEYLKALRVGIQSWLNIVDKEIDIAEKRDEQRARDAGEMFVHEHPQLFTEDADVESYATDLAAALKLDAEEVAEGMRKAIDDIEKEPSTCERNGGCARCHWGAADH
jgi:hypothetical protein